MNNNSFVSIYFTIGKIFIVKLKPSKKRVELYATVDLPSNLIHNHEVTDVKLLADILSRVWKKLRIKERLVGIVIPEFSTFTKAIDLPKLEPEEIAEAVKWQAEEYIPLELDDMLLDWKRIKENKDGIRVLVVAVNKSLLTGYISSIDMAGLLPLVVETPSISLVRTAGSEVEVKLVIYFSPDEIIISLSKGEEILTSSVIDSNSSASVLVSTIARIIRHFDEVSIQKIFVGGVPANNSFLTEISKNFKAPLEKLNFKLSGISENDIQKYIIPISLQYKAPHEPKSEETVNLLPLEIIDKYKKKRLGIQLWGLMLTVTLIVMGCLMALTGTYLYFLQRLSKYKNIDTLSSASYQKSKTASNEIKSINMLADRTLKIDSVSVYPQEILNLIYQKKSDAIAILSYKIDLEKGEILINGLAQGRDSLFEFKERLEEDGSFTNIVLPISSYQQGENIEFQMGFVYAKIASSKK